MIDDQFTEGNCPSAVWGQFWQGDEVGRFRKAVNDGKDDCLSRGVQGDMGPGTTGHWKRAEQTSGRFIGRFGVGAHLAGRHEGPTVLVHKGPPEPLAQQEEGARHPGVSAEPGGVHPLEDLVADT